MKLFWTGTDSLMLVDYSMRKWLKRPYWFMFRILVRILDGLFVEQHYCDSENVADNLRKFWVRRPVKIVHDDVKYHDPMPKIHHVGFNVIYYNPTNRRGGDKEFTRWLYGIDIIEKIKDAYPMVNYIELDGTKDMAEIYPISDMMIRPNRHDGASRIRQECEINNIPYYWTQANPSITDCMNEIKREYVKHQEKAKL